MAATSAPRPLWWPCPGTVSFDKHQYDAQQVYVIKMREYFCFYYLLAIQ
jgi:hypothetical protein